MPSRLGASKKEEHKHSQPPVDAITKILEDQDQKDAADYMKIEKKRMQYIKNLSLAQRLGLVEKPALPLSQQ